MSGNRPIYKLVFRDKQTKKYQELAAVWSPRGNAKDPSFTFKNVASITLTDGTVIKPNQYGDSDQFYCNFFDNTPEWLR